MSKLKELQRRKRELSLQLNQAKEDLMRPQAEKVAKTLLSLLRETVKTKRVSGYCMQGDDGVHLRFKETEGLLGWYTSDKDDTEHKDLVELWVSFDKKGKHCSLGLNGTNKRFSELVKKILRTMAESFKRACKKAKVKEVQFYLHSGDHYFHFYHNYKGVRDGFDR